MTFLGYVTKLHAVLLNRSYFRRNIIMGKRTGRHAILEQLRADNIKYMFGNPGTVEQGFLDALQKVPEVEYILGLQESVPVGIADGYARATKKPAVVQLHSGVGLGNGIGMMYQAMRGHAPLVVIGGDSGVCYEPMDAQMACDLIAMAEPVTKWAAKATDSRSVLRMLRRAIKIASTPPMGPVYLVLPMDVLDEPNYEEIIPTPILKTNTVPDGKALEELAEILAAAESPMIIIGDGVSASNAQNELTQVAEISGAEVWGSDSSEANIDACHPQFMGLLGHMFGTYSAPITSKADAVLIVGTYVFPEVFPAFSQVFKKGAKVGHIDLNAYEIAKNFPVDVGVVADPKRTLKALAEVLAHNMAPEQKEAAGKRARKLGEKKKETRKAELEADRQVKNDIPMRASAFMEAFSKRLPEDSIVVDEALTCSPELNRYMPARKPGHFFQTRGGSLGIGIPTAIGVKLANPDKMVVAFTGDGGSMYTIQALWTASKHKLNIKVVICNNHCYKLLKLNVQEYWKERDIPEHSFPSMFELDKPPINFVELANSMGVEGVLVEKPEDIKDALDKAFANDRPFLINMVISSMVPGHEDACKCGQ